MTCNHTGIHLKRGTPRRTTCYQCGADLTPAPTECEPRLRAFIEQVYTADPVAIGAAHAMANLRIARGAT